MIKYYVIPRKNPINKKVKYYAMKDGAGAARFTTDQMYKTMSETSNVPIAYIPQALEAIAQAVQMFVLNGHCVTVGDLGSFQPVIKSSGALSADEFSASHIKSYKMAFVASPQLKRAALKANMSFLRYTPEPKENGGGEDGTA